MAEMLAEMKEMYWAVSKVGLMVAVMAVLLAALRAIWRAEWMVD